MTTPLDLATTLPVHFKQKTPWGGRTFRGALIWHRDILTDAWEPALRIDDAPEHEGWAGLILTALDVMPGRFASGGCGDLSGKFFWGRQQIYVGDTAASCAYRYYPVDVFPGRPRNLHTELAELTEAQRQLGLAAIRYDRDPHFSAGSSLVALYSLGELEGRLTGQIAYNLAVDTTI